MTLDIKVFDLGASVTVDGVQRLFTVAKYGSPELAQEQAQKYADDIQRFMDADLSKQDIMQSIDLLKKVIDGVRTFYPIKGTDFIPFCDPYENRICVTFAECLCVSPNTDETYRVEFFTYRHLSPVVSFTCNMSFDTLVEVLCNHDQSNTMMEKNRRVYLGKAKNIHFANDLFCQL